MDSGARRPVVPVSRIDQVQNVQSEVAEDLVSLVNRERSRALQDIVEVGLRDSDHPSQGAFGNGSALDTSAEFREEAKLEGFEGHVLVTKGYFQGK